jgi:hypothetical protein
MASIQVEGFLADSVVTSEGKMYVQGAGWNRISAASFPVVHDRIGIGLLFRFDVSGASQSHRFELRLEDAKGNELPLGDAPPGPQSPGKITRIGGEFGAGPGAAGAAEQLVPIAINLNGMAFAAPNAFRFVVSVDGEDVKKLPFRVEQFAPQRPQVTGGGGYL